MKEFHVVGGGDKDFFKDDLSKCEVRGRSTLENFYHYNIFKCV